jgi:hypothetical protein
MEKLVALSIMTGLAMATPAIVSSTHPVAAQVAPSEFRGLDLYITEFSMLTGRGNTAKLNLNIRNRASGPRVLTRSEEYAIRGIRMVDGRTGNRYSVSTIDEAALAKPLGYSGETNKVRLEFGLPLGIRPTHLEIDTDADRLIKIRL